MKLNQTIALETGAKKKSEVLTDAYQRLQKTALITGLARSYTPRDEDGEARPSESQRVQLRVEEEIERVALSLTEWFDITATKDWANCSARANIEVEGKVLLKDVPVTYLLFLEKRLVDLHTFVEKLPVHDPAESWHYDPGQSCFATEAVESVRTKKVMKNHVKAQATDKHPAQVDVYTEDVPEGTWRSIKYTGAAPLDRVRELTRRVEALQNAVKLAREQANMIEAPKVEVGKPIFDYLFAA